MGTAHLEVVQSSLQALILHDVEVRLLAQRARLLISPHGPDTDQAEAVAATADDQRRAENLQADGAFDLELFRRRMEKFELTALGCPLALSFQRHHFAVEGYFVPRSRRTLSRILGGRNARHIEMGGQERAAALQAGNSTGKEVTNSKE